MRQQKSFSEDTEMGSLYLVPTPIGNLEDMTFRAINIMKSSDLIAAEDTRQTKKLCRYFEIETPIISYHEHNKEMSGPKIVDLLKQGKQIALVSDAGMPTISDPGSELVQQVIEERGKVIPLPGANAALTALIASGINVQPFFFFGFLDRSKKGKKKQLEELRARKETLIFYESPHRLKETLQLMRDIFGERNISLTRELTKKFEEFIRGTLTEAVNWSQLEEIRGEFCLIVQGNQDETTPNPDQWWDSLSEKEHVQHYIDKGLPSKDAIKQAAKDRDIPKRDVYQAFHIETKDS